MTDDDVAQTKYIIKDQVFNLIYPVGSYYWTDSVDFDPNKEFGGAWEPIRDRFVLAAGDIYSGGDLGGEAEHELSIEEIPSHRHWISNAAWDDGNGTGTTGTNQDNGLWSDAGSYQVNDQNKSNGRYDCWAGGSNGDSGRGTSKGHTTAHNNMPPYIVAYCWHRID